VGRRRVKCELCESDGGRLVWRNAECRVVLVEEPGYAGYCRAIWNAHVPEMTDLSRAERARFMDVVFALEAALRRRLRPDKINLASLGNATPHLHWHVVARFRDDPHFPGSVWAAPVRAVLQPAPFDASLAAALARALADC
jgi:diadenosine tetraphosphate (Ap4A) HIT family hydrolase